MGDNTTIVVMNDALSEIASDPNFGRTLAGQIAMHNSGPTYVRAGGHVNAAQVIARAHASNASLVLTGGNTGKLLATVFNRGRYSTLLQQRQIIEAWASSHDLRLTRVGIVEKIGSLAADEKDAEIARLKDEIEALKKQINTGT